MGDEAFEEIGVETVYIAHEIVEVVDRLLDAKMKCDMAEFMF